MKKATRQQTKNHNTQLILKTIYENGDISRADIARATRLTRPTVSALVTELIDNQFVVETGLGPSAGGKPPTLLNIAQDAYHLLSVDLGSQAFRGAVVNLRGEIVERLSFPTHDRKGEAALQLVYKLIDSLVEVSTVPLLGIGVGTPGLVDSRQGIIQRAVNLGWTDLPLRDLIENRYQKPSYLANDSHMAALAEYAFGQPRDSNNLVVIKIGQGIGAGIILNGQLYYGDGFGAGEIGHVVVAEDGLLCTCGNYGCLETTTSTRSILRQAREIAGSQPTSHLAAAAEVEWQTIVAALEAGDAATHTMVATAGKYLGVAIANLVGSLNIHHVVVSGRVSQLGDVFLDAARTETRRRVLPAMAAATEVAYSTLGSDIVILGSSAMTLKHELGIT